MILKPEELAASVKGQIYTWGYVNPVSSFSTDTRGLKQGDFFIPIKGEAFDGHSFIYEALKKGACGSMASMSWAGNPQEINEIENNIKLGKFFLIRVEDTLKALQKLAHHFYIKLKPTVIAITGSNGKTTTKEMIASILSVRFNILKNIGNLNNQIGLPLTLLNLREDHKIVVLEMGMNAPGEILTLTKIAKPDIGVITNISEAHLEGFESVEAIAKAKFELFEGGGDEMVGILNQDDEWISKYIPHIRNKLRTFSVLKDSNLRPVSISVKNSGVMDVVIKNSNQLIIQLPGIHNVYNALASLSVGLEFNLNFSEMAKNLESFVPPEMRMQRIEINGTHFFNDAYNANPASMLVAVQTLAEIPCNGKKIYILGDMLELGKGTEKMHFDLGLKIGVQNPPDILFTFGNYGRIISKGAEHFIKNLEHFESKEELALRLIQILKPGDHVLIKASRRVRMEDVLELVKKGTCDAI